LIKVLKRLIISIAFGLSGRTKSSIWSKNGLAPK